MATLNQISQSYADSIGKPFDHMLKERIKFSVKYWRAKLVRDEFERNGADRSLLQSIVMPLTKVDAADSCVVKVGCTVTRTEDKVPRPITTKGPSTFNYVGPIRTGCGTKDGTAIESSSADMEFACYEEYTSESERFEYKNGYVYYYGKKLMKYVQIEGYFEDTEAANALCEEAGNCVTDDEEFPIGLHMLSTILRGLRNAELQLLTDDQEVKIDA